jgi:hypothetical protein
VARPDAAVDIPDAQAEEGESGDGVLSVRQENASPH